MRRPIITIAAFLSCVFLAGSPSEDINEILRRKVEMMGSATINVEDQRIHCSEALPRFYERRAFETAWDNIQDGKRFVNELKRAEQHGLDPLDYHIELIEEMLSKEVNSLQKKAELDLLLTDAFLLYGSHLISGKVDPKKVDPEWYVRKDQKDAVLLLEQAIGEGKALDILRTNQPGSEVYRSLKKALEDHRKIVAEGGWGTVDAGETIKPGMTDPRVAQVRERLRVTGEWIGQSAATPNSYDDELKESVIRFQARHGLDADGAIGKRTMEVMNIPADRRVDQIRANMERWRWLDQEVAPYRVMVNIADYKLEVFDQGNLVRSHKVMVGKTARRTPVFQSSMQYLVLNPTWTVPPTILRNDVIPAVRKDPNYLSTKGLQVLDASGQQIDPTTVDWSSSKVFSYTYRQPAGKSNALGAVKFMFPNSFNVYIHDTPSKELFGQADRAFSSGCIRVQHPMDLTKYMLADQASWTAEKIDKAIASGQTQTINLTRRPGVYILYWTAWVDAEGVVQFRTDVYDRDTRLVQALDQNSPSGFASR